MNASPFESFSTDNATFEFGVQTNIAVIHRNDRAFVACRCRYTQRIVVSRCNTIADQRELDIGNAKLIFTGAKLSSTLSRFGCRRTTIGSLLWRCRLSCRCTATVTGYLKRWHESSHNRNAHYLAEHRYNDIFRIGTMSQLTVSIATTG